MHSWPNATTNDAGRPILVTDTHGSRFVYTKPTAGILLIGLAAEEKEKPAVTTSDGVED